MDALHRTITLIITAIIRGLPRADREAIAEMTCDEIAQRMRVAPGGLGLQAQELRDIISSVVIELGADLWEPEVETRRPSSAVSSGELLGALHRRAQ